MRLLSAPLTAAFLLLGVWLAGGVVTNDFATSVALTTAWFGVAGAACLLIALRSRALRAPVIAAYVVTAAVVGGYLGLSTLRDRVVDERVVTAAARPANTELARGRFRSGEHETRGVATVVGLPGGRRVLTLTAFATSPGPDLRVRLDGLDLGALKGNRGDQQYELPRRAALGGASVVIWCRAFSVAFGSARL